MCVCAVIMYVCIQIVRHKLLSPENLRKQTQTNRLLALDVLNFISHHQVSYSYQVTLSQHQVVSLPGQPSY